MSKITLTDLANLENENTAVNAINTNSDIITLAFDNTLSRDGTAPNQMQADLDMNSNHILNLPTPTSQYEPIRLIDAGTLGTGGTITVNPLPAGGTTGQSLKKNSNTNYDVSWGTPTVPTTSLTGTLQAAQFPALTGPVTTSAGSLATTVGNNVITNANLSQAAANTLKGNPTNALANVAEFTIPSLTSKAAVGASDYILVSDSAAGGQLKKVLGSGINTSSSTFDPRNFGAVGNGIADDYTAISACITAAVAAGGTITLQDGTYKHSGTLNWAFNRLRVVAVGANVSFLHSGVGNAHSFSGIANYPATQGCAGATFGEGNRIWIRGNPAGGTTNGLLIDNYHFGYISVSVRDCSNAMIKAQDTGIVGASAVETTFDVRISQNVDGSPFSVVPSFGTYWEWLAACKFDQLTVEACGVGSRAVQFHNCVGNAIYCGTVESNNAGGVYMNPGCHRNIIEGVHAEVNGAQEDWYIEGHHNTFIGCIGAATASGSKVLGKGNVFINGQFQSMVLTAASTENTFHSTELLTAFTDSGTENSLINPDNTGISGAFDGATLAFRNKTLNTASGNTLQINSNTVSSVTGSGSVVVLQTSPTLISAALGTPVSGSLGSCTGYTVANLSDNAWTTYTPTVTSQSGTPTTVSATGRYKIQGKTITVQIQVTVTAVGTASGYIQATLPTASTANSFNGCSQEQAITGHSGTCWISSAATGSCRMSKYDVSSYWVAGYVVNGQVTYEIP